MNLVNPDDLSRALAPILDQFSIRILNTLADTRAHLPGEIADAVRNVLHGAKITVNVEMPPPPAK